MDKIELLEIIAAKAINDRARELSLADEQKGAHQMSKQEYLQRSFKDLKFIIESVKE